MSSAVTCVVVLLLLCSSVVVADIPLRIISTGPTVFSAMTFDNNGNLWTCSLQGNLTQMTPTGSIRATYQIKLGCLSLTVDSYNQLYVGTNQINANSVYRMSTANGSILATFDATNGKPETLAVDRSYLYASSSQSSRSFVIVWSLATGLVVRTFNVNGSYAYHPIAIDPITGYLFVGIQTGVQRITNTGQVLNTFLPFNTTFSYTLFLAVSTDGSVAVTDKSRVIRFNNTGYQTHIYTMPTKFYSPWTLAFEPATGNLFVNSNSNFLVFVPPEVLSCTTGPEVGYYRLSQLTDNGADLQGVDSSRNFLYVWSVCGTVREPNCALLAPNANVCGLTIPITTALTISQRTDVIDWQFYPNTTKSIGVSGFSTNGPTCGRLGRKAQLLYMLTCAKYNDKTIVMDDSMAQPSADLCLYVLSFNTPAVCPTGIDMSLAVKIDHELLFVAKQIATKQYA